MYQPSNDLPLPQREQLDKLAEQFKSDFLDGLCPAIQDYIDRFPALRPHLLATLITLEIDLRRRNGEGPTLDEYRRRFPRDSVLTEMEVFGQQQTVDWETVSAGRPKDSGGDSQPEQEQPENVGRYQVQRRLGRGGFGIVYLAHDPHLNRPVALKVPRQARLRTAEQIDLFVREARAAANLKHPGLVSVYDVQEWDNQWFIVQEYVDGKHLGSWSAEHQPSYPEIAKVFVSITEALGAAHQHGLTHCDLKLTNVLMDDAGKPHVADFGLAVHESVRLTRKGERFGTPFTMAPEQVRGEGHRLDGRTDIWAVGVMLYQLLTNHRPFDARKQGDLYDQILTLDPKPPRQMDRSIPKELERICLKCLSKRRSDRYNTTDDLREDLSAWLESVAYRAGESSSIDQTRSDSGPLPYDISSKSKPPLKVIPKGLRSFDDDDADFFLELLPGPRDRNGIPETVRFWKKRIEETDRENTFSVGLIYGPSGCGKSSLVKAGLLPRLGSGVLPIFLEATSNDTEVRILHQLRKQVPRLEASEDLMDACTQLRRGTTGTGRKTLLVIDQFEQWLHANKDRENTELAQALRQADGERFQCVLLVRDDFWMAVTRFLRELEVNLIDGHNLAAVDLFSERHARYVLTAFGRAFAALPEDPGEMTQEQVEFVQQSVSELADNGKVVSVRLALFAEMMKNRAWVLQSLRDVGGASGVGEAFLEENLSSRFASPEHRYHERAARSVLTVLLPEVGTQIKGYMRSHEELAEASGYPHDSREFAGLLRMLDGELRLITPTDPEGMETGTDSESGAKFYQLTHDYLVSSLRIWLTRKQRETRQGRAQLRLAELTAAWNAKPETRNLPSLAEWLWFLTHLPKRDRSAPQNLMMHEATKRHARRLCGWTLAVVVAISSVWFSVQYAARVSEQHRFESMLAQIWTSELSHLADLLKQLEPRRDEWRGQITKVADSESHNPADRTRAHLALAGDENHPLDYLVERLVHAGRSEHQVILDVLKERKADLVPDLEERLQSHETSPSELVRAASALALLGDPNQLIGEVSSQLVDSLVRSDPIEAARWSDTLVAAHDQLSGPLCDALKDRSRPASQRYLMASLISDIARVSPDTVSDLRLADIVMAASPEEYSTLLPAIRYRVASIIPFFHDELDRPVELEQTDQNKQRLSRQAIAAETILRIGGDEDRIRFMELLDLRPDPRLRSRLIDRLDEIMKPPELLERIEQENRPHIRQALVFGLGEGIDSSSGELPALVHQRLAGLYLSDPHSGVHSASEWALRRGGQEQAIGQLAKQAQESMSKERTWFINSEGQTMIQLSAPGEFIVGSPSWELGRDDHEAERTVRISYDFSISAHEVTVRQFNRFSPGFSYPKSVSPQLDCPITSVSHSDAIAYCRWLTERERKSDAEGDASADQGDLPAYEYSLPTADEWEYAARAGTRTSRFFGNDPDGLGRYAWYGANSAEQTHRVGQLHPNPFGLFDVYGNATEWCRAVAALDEDLMPVRGGHYRATPKFLRSSMQVYFDSPATLSIVGFRIVKRPLGRTDERAAKD